MTEHIVRGRHEDAIREARQNVDRIDEALRYGSLPTGIAIVPRGNTVGQLKAMLSGCQSDHEIRFWLREMTDGDIRQYYADDYQREALAGRERRRRDGRLRYQNIGEIYDGRGLAPSSNGFVMFAYLADRDGAPSLTSVRELVEVLGRLPDDREIRLQSGIPYNYETISHVLDGAYLTPPLNGYVIFPDAPPRPTEAEIAAEKAATLALMEAAWRAEAAPDQPVEHADAQDAGPATTDDDIAAFFLKVFLEDAEPASEEEILSAMGRRITSCKMDNADQRPS